MSKVKINIDKSLKECIYIQIYDSLKKQILSGEISVGTKLPSIRQVAMKLDVNQNTIIQSYNLLEEKGLIKKVSGKGCFVEEVCVFKVEEKEIPLIESFKYGQNPKVARINFSNGTPSSKYFPLNDYRKFMDEVFSEYKADIFQYQNIQGV
ncbi:MAG: GntR family transcriptional regulator, partial [Cetobacterium sp.]